MADPQNTADEILQGISVQDDRYRRILGALIKRTLGHAHNQGTKDFFTIHDDQHCLAVQKMAGVLIAKSRVERSEVEKSKAEKGEAEKSGVDLSDLESFILYSAVWTHDLGMFHDIASKMLGDDYSSRAVRDRHDEISAWYLAKEYESILSDAGLEDAANRGMFRNCVYTVNIASKYHRRKNSISECPVERYIGGKRIRTRLLASLLLLADALHIDSSRFDRRMYDILQLGYFDRVARFHWLKSFLVSNVFLDPAHETIVVSIDVPESYRQADRQEDIEILETTITEEIREDALAAYETFRQNGLVAYTRVVAQTNFVPGFPKERKHEIDGVIGDLGVASSPNASKVVDKAISSIRALCSGEHRFASYQVFDTQMGELIKYLNSVRRDRPCHVGLTKLVEAVESTFNECRRTDLNAAKLAHITDCQNRIDEQIKHIEEERKASKEAFMSILRHSQVLNGVKNVILFAYSETVLDFLQMRAEADRTSHGEPMKFYVLEGGPKRRFSSHNRLEYSDGIHYALELSKRGCRNIHLLPDAALASLCAILCEKESPLESVVLFGVDGIKESSGDCGHTSGHLTVAIVARHFGIPVKVLADSFKHGKIDWNLKNPRESQWLTGERRLMSHLKAHGITLINYHDDRIPASLVGSDTVVPGSGL